MSNLGVLDTRFRSALRRMIEAARLRTYAAEADVDLEIAAIMKRLDAGPALMFTRPRGFDVPIVGNLLGCRENCEAAFGLDYRGIRELVGRALGNPLKPELVDAAPAQECVERQAIDVGKALPILRHTPADPGRFFTSGIVVVRDPDTGVHNASFHRLQFLGPNRTAVRLDYGRHLRGIYERAKKRGTPLPIAVCIGTDLALQYTAATMGSQMPESADELSVAGGLAGRPLRVARGVSQDILVPADSEIVLEGRMLADESVLEGPFGEFIGIMSAADQAPVFEITALTHRKRPIYHAINGYGRETVMLRKYVLEASLLKVLSAASPIVADAEMTAGGLHRFHAVLQVRKTSSHHDGLQRNAMLAAFGALKDLDMIIVVDDDIDIRDPADVEYALATRLEASRGLFVLPEARSHEMVKATRDGIRGKLGIDATVPFAEQGRYRRCTFKQVNVDWKDTSGPEAAERYLG